MRNEDLLDANDSDMQKGLKEQVRTPSSAAGEGTPLRPPERSSISSSVVLCTLSWRLAEHTNVRLADAVCLRCAAFCYLATR